MASLSSSGQGAKAAQPTHGNEESRRPAPSAAYRQEFFDLNTTKITVTVPTMQATAGEAMTGSDEVQVVLTLRQLAALLREAV